MENKKCKFKLTKKKCIEAEKCKIDDGKGNYTPRENCTMWCTLQEEVEATQNKLKFFRNLKN